MSRVEFQSLLIALSTEMNSLQMKQEMMKLYDWEHVEIATAGDTVYQYLIEKQPDVAILDFHLSEYDGIEILKRYKAYYLQMKQEKNRLKSIRIVMLFYNHQETWIRKAYEYGATYCAIKPCEPSILMERIQSFGAQNMQVYGAKYVAEQALLKMGFSATNKGTSYIQEAIALIIENDYEGNVCQMVYEVIADRFQVSTMSIERAIRYSVEQVWKNKNNKLLLYIFGRERLQQKKPSNSEFLWTVAKHFQYITCI